VITDGEVRRESYSNRFALALEGVEAGAGAKKANGVFGQTVPLITGPVKWLGIPYGYSTYSKLTHSKTHSICANSHLCFCSQRQPFHLTYFIISENDGGSGSGSGSSSGGGQANASSSACVLGTDLAFLRRCKQSGTFCKITLPGPFTMSEQCENRYYETKAECCMALAKAVNCEVRALLAAGADVVQLDEPYLQLRHGIY
jgi:methionine synthase II (cobalamin-independent)